MELLTDTEFQRLLNTSEAFRRSTMAVCCAIGLVALLITDVFVVKWFVIGLSKGGAVGDAVTFLLSIMLGLNIGLVCSLTGHAISRRLIPVRKD